VSVVPSFSIPAWQDIKPLIVASSSLLLRSLVLQLSLSGAAAMAARTGTQSAAASVAARQIAIQLWLFCNFICDALEAAAQCLVADALGRESQSKAREYQLPVPFVLQFDSGRYTSGSPVGRRCRHAFRCTSSRKMLPHNRRCKKLSSSSL
jgi:hypothetical protein